MAKKNRKFGHKGKGPGGRWHNKKGAWKKKWAKHHKKGGKWGGKKGNYDKVYKVEDTFEQRDDNGDFEGP